MPAAGVPASVAVPLPLSTKVTPLGRAARPMLASRGPHRQPRRGRDRERPHLAHSKRHVVRASNRRRIEHCQREHLHGLGRDPVAGLEVECEGADDSPRPTTERRRAVVVIDESDADRQRAVTQAQGRVRVTLDPDREAIHLPGASGRGAR